MPDPEMMKTSVFALDQRGPGGGEGEAGEGREWLCSRAPSAEPAAETRASRATMQVAAHPGKGAINRWGRGPLPRRSLSWEDSSDCALGIVQFHIVSECSQQRPLSQGTAVGQRRRRGKRQMNPQVGKEGGKEGGEEELAGAFADSKILLFLPAEMYQNKGTTSPAKPPSVPQPATFPAAVAFPHQV